MAVINATAADDVYVAPTDAVSNRMSDQFNDGIQTVESTAVSCFYHVNAASGIGVSPFVTVVQAQLVTLADGIGGNDALTALLGVVLFDAIRVNDAPSATGVYHITASDVLSVADAIYLAYPALISESINVAPTELIKQGLVVLESLRLNDALVPAGIYRYTVSEILSLADSIARFFGATVAEGIGVNDALGNTLKTFGLVSEGVGVADTQTPQLIIRMTMADGIGVSPTQALRMVYKQTVTEGIELAAAYISPTS